MLILIVMYEDQVYIKEFAVYSMHINDFQCILCIYECCVCELRMGYICTDI